jgi:hypothetical protein
VIRMEWDLDPGQLNGIGRDALEAQRPGILRAVTDATLHLLNALKMKVGGVGRGRLYKRGKSGRMHQASAPGDPPARDLGNYVNSWDHNIQNQPEVIEGAVGSYMWETRGKLLEGGTRKMRPRPHVDPVLAEERQAIEGRLQEP